MTDGATRAALGGEFGDFSAVLRQWAALQPDAVALRDDAGEAGWAELHDGIERIAARLVATGLRPGGPVAILGASGIGYALAFLGAVRAGGVAAPLTTSATPQQLAAMLDDSGATHLFIDAAKRAELGEDFGSGLERVPLEELGGWMAPPGTRAPRRDPAPESPFNIIYSSGTTGTPKGIVHSHQMRWRQFAATATSWLEAGLPVRSLASTPLYSNTTMVGFLPVLLAGGTVTIMAKFDTTRWLALAETTAATIAMLVPVQYRRLLADPALDTTDLSSLALKYCTSAPFPAELKREVLARMPGALIEIYSMTEGGVVCLLEAHKFPEKLHTVGRPAPGSELKILDDEDREVPAGTAGHLVGISHTMMSGYRNRPEATRQGYWTDPATGRTWQRMGDIGRIDADGFLELVGRAKDMIISGGFNIYPADLEAELEREPEVAEAAVIGVPSERWGETPVGFVVLATEAQLGALRERVNARLGKTQRLAQLYAIDAMPRSHIGKLLKSDLRERAGALALQDEPGG
jgi:acyl-CoA synthetase (AMP-forming)/AMP-acid ligase II